MNFNTVVVRKQMLAECFGAHLWNKMSDIKIMVTDAVTEMNNSMLEEIKDKDVLIVGGYYKNNMKPIIYAAKNLTIFYNNSDKYNQSNDYIALVADKNKGFASWTVEQLKISDDYILRIADYLDQYLYGHPSEEALCFQNGVYMLNGVTDLEKIKTIKNHEDIENAIEKGREKRINNLRIAKNRADWSTELPLKFNNNVYNVCVAIGDSPIVDTCIVLADRSSSGIGLLLRYDLKSKRTYLSARVKHGVEVNMGEFMHSLVGGGGSYVMGGGSVSGFVSPFTDTVLLQNE
jgi:hypothetical protein